MLAMVAEYIVLRQALYHVDYEDQWYLSMD